MVQKRKFTLQQMKKTKFILHQIDNTCIAPKKKNLSEKSVNLLFNVATEQQEKIYIINPTHMN